MDRPWRNRDLLSELYLEEGYTISELTEEFDCAKQTIRRWMDKHGIEARPGQPIAAEELEDESWLREVYVDRGLSTTDIAELLDCTNATVGNWLERHGIEARPVGVPKNERICNEDEMRELYFDEGMTLGDIADELGVGQSTVKRWFDRHGIERRDPREYFLKHGERNRNQFHTPRKEIQEEYSQCQICGMSNEAHIEEYGQRLETHHIIPLRQFDANDPKRHALDNLTLLCIPCHRRWEGVPLTPTRD